MNDKSLQKDMSLITYIKTLKFLRNNNDSNVRILWWEPLLSPNIKKFLQIASKWWFDTIIFSNINLPPKVIFDKLSWLNNLRINCNINEKSFYSKQELNNIDKNLYILNKLWIKIILWHNILNTDIENIDFVFSLAKKHNITSVNLKITNHLEQSDMNKRKEFWSFLFNIIQKYEKNFFIEFSCWLDKNIFSKEELEYIKYHTKLDLKFWCEGNAWGFDINTDGKIFRCFLFKNKNFYKNIFIEENLNLKQILEINKLFNWRNGCIAIKHINNCRD
jgi:hypothetical protein